MRLPVVQLPDLDYPALTVWTAYTDVPPSGSKKTATKNAVPEEGIAVSRHYTLAYGAPGAVEETHKLRME